jgi:hypothetical protein
MNWELFTAFLLITVVLVVTPGPIVTLVAVMCAVSVALAACTDSAWAVAAGLGRGCS